MMESLTYLLMVAICPPESDLKNLFQGLQYIVFLMTKEHSTQNDLRPFRVAEGKPFTAKTGATILYRFFTLKNNRDKSYIKNIFKIWKFFF